MSKNMNYLNKEKTQCLKGLLAILIVLHHTLQNMDNSSYFYPKGIGYLVVAVFYFISGYGLTQSLNTNRNYLDDFIRKRLLKVYIPFFLATFINLIVKFLLGHSYSIKMVALSLIGGAVIVNFSWYIFSVLLFYTAFYLSYRFLHGKLPLYAMLAFTVLYTACAYMIHLQNWWYISCFTFVLGILWCSFQESIDIFITVHFKKILVVVSAVFWASFLNLFSGGFSRIFQVTALSNRVILLEYFISSFCFCILALLLIMKIDIESRALIALGGLSGEIYLMQGLAIKELKGNVICIRNNLIYLFLVMCITFVFATLLKNLNKIINSAIKPKSAKTENLEIEERTNTYQIK